MRKKEVVVLILFLLIFEGVSYIPKAYSQNYTDKDKAFAFISDVIQLDLTQYQPVVKYAGTINMASLGPTATEVFIQLAPDIQLSSGGMEAGFHCIFELSNGIICFFSMSGANMTMHYSQVQPSTALDKSKGILQRYQTYIEQYYGTDISYLRPMIAMLNSISEPASTVQISDNVQMKIDYTSGIQQISSIERALITKTDITWTYTNNGVNVTRKNVYLDFPNGTLSHFTDTWNLLSIGTWNMISKEEALSLAFKAAQGVTLQLASSNGTISEIKPELSDISTGSLSMAPRNEFSVLYPFWYVEIYFNKSYGSQYGVQVGIWADTKEIAYCQSMGVLGSYGPQDPPTTSTAQPSLSPTPSPSPISSPTATSSNIAPIISIMYPTNGTVVESFMGAVGIGWQYPANTTFSWVGCSLNGGGNTTVTGKNEIGYIENNGDYTFTLYANDTAGNWATPQTVTFHVHVIGDALQEKPIAVAVIITLIIAVIILFALAVLVAYRRHQKNQKNQGKKLLTNKFLICSNYT